MRNGFENIDLSEKILAWSGGPLQSYGGLSQHGPHKTVSVMRNPREPFFVCMYSTYLEYVFRAMRWALGLRFKIDLIPQCCKATLRMLARIVSMRHLLCRPVNEFGSSAGLDRSLHPLTDDGA